MSKPSRVGQFGEIATSKMGYGGDGAYPKVLEGMTFNSTDSSLTARPAMAYKIALQNSGESKDVFTCYLRNWDLILTNLQDNLLIEVFNKNNNTLSSITVTGGHISTFAYVIEIASGFLGQNATVNPVVGVSAIFIAGINQPMVYLDDTLTLRTWLVLAESGARVATPIVEDLDITQGRLTILVPKAIGATTVTAFNDVGIDTPWIYMSAINSYDNFKDNIIKIQPKNYETLKFYAITAFRNVLAVIHSGGLSIVKALDAATEAITQANLVYYLADESEALPMKAVGFNNILIYASRTGLRGRTLLEDPLTNQMTGFKMPTMCQRFLNAPTRIFKKPYLSQLCIFDNYNLYSYSEIISTEKGGQLFPRTTYISSNQDFLVEAINEEAAVIKIGDARFLVNDYKSDILSIGLIDNYYPSLSVLGSGPDWIRLNLPMTIEKIAVLLSGSWQILYRIGDNKFSGFVGTQIPTSLSVIPLVGGSGVTSILPSAMQNPYYQWYLKINDKDVYISGDSVNLALEGPLVITKSKICAYAAPLSFVLACTATTYDQSIISNAFLLTDKNVETIGTFNQVPSIQRTLAGIPAEYKFNVKFSPTERNFTLTITPRLNQSSDFTVEQLILV